ncbi:MAG: hypothetical protein AAB786_00775 [Patescibacteria group bacterium]
METYKKNWLKFTLGFVACFLIRLIPFRPPNIEPILATQMPFSRAYGAYAGFLFAFFSIIFFDLITGHFGIWSLITAGTYGVLGFGATFYFRNKNPGSLDYASFAILGTLFFDAVTGLSIGPLFFQQSFMEALMGQIPFTLWHLLGNVSFALILSPAIYNFVIKNEKLENISLMNLFNPKKI